MTFPVDETKADRYRDTTKRWPSPCARSDFGGIAKSSPDGLAVAQSILYSHRLARGNNLGSEGFAVVAELVDALP
jgi:hypothetical protein